MRGIRSRVRAYYSEAIDQHGPTPLGVDWPNAASQYLRFLQLLRICDFDRAFSLNDFGCGYGALLEYLMLRHRGARIAYNGIDLSPSMIAAADKRWAKRPHTTLRVASRCLKMADYSVASGVFNVRLGQPVEAWEAYVAQILHDLFNHSRMGFAVNFMLPHDNAPSESELYRTRRSRWLNYCRKELGCTVEPLTGYGLREFTLLARRRA
jgi:SAM-dependent methyltransferase